MPQYRISENEKALIDKIAARARAEMTLVKGDRLVLKLAACQAGAHPLRLRDLAAAPAGEFADDVAGIITQFDLDAGQMKDFYVPKYSATDSPNPRPNNNGDHKMATKTREPEQVAGPLEVSKDEAQAMFQALGVKSADGWRRTRMQKELDGLSKTYDPETDLEDPAAQATFDSIMEAQGDEREVLLVAAHKQEGEEAETEAEELAAKPAKKKPAATASSDPEPDGAEETAVAPPKAAKKKRAESNGESTGPKGRTVRRIEGSESYCAGRAFARLGLGEKVTEKHVEQIKKWYKGNNPSRTSFVYSARNALRGYLGETDEKPARSFLAGQLVKELGLTDTVPAEAIAEVNTRYGKANDGESMACLVAALQTVAGYEFEVAKK